MRDDLDSVEEQVTQVAVYEPASGTSYRILINYNNELLPLFWIEVMSDGSIIIGSSQKESNFLATGNSPIKSDKVHVKYADVLKQKDTKKYKNPSKTTFHASEIINTIGGEGPRAKKAEHRTIDSQTLLCMLLFRHPNDQKRTTTYLRPTDIFVEYPYDEARPLQAYIYLGELQTKPRPIKVDGATAQINMMLNYRNLHNCNDLEIQIILAHGPKGEWPPYNFKLFPVQR